MPAYIKVAGNWNEITGTEQPYVKVSGTWRSVSQIHAKVGGVWKQVYEYDNTGPTVNLTLGTPAATSDPLSWTITDAQSGVASATLQQVFTQNGTPLTAVTYSIPGGSLASGSYSFPIPTNRRNTPTGDVFQVKYRIVAVDNAGNTTTTSYTSNHYTKPLGTYAYVNTAADSRNLTDTAWLGTTTEGIVGYSTTSRLYGGWFYGTDTFQDDNFAQWEPDSGTLYVKRASAAQTNRGNSGTFYLQGHSSGTKTGALTFVGSQISVALSGNDADAYVTLNAGMLANIKSGSLQGFGLSYFYSSAGNIGFLRGLSDFSGLVTLVYN